MTTTRPDQDRLAARVLERIEEDHVVPRPRVAFLFRNYTFWTLGALAVILGAFAFAAALFEVENAGWQFAIATHGGFLSLFLSAAPFLWVFALLLFLLLGYVNIRRTRRGYRYPLAVIALGAVLTSVALGTGLYAAGLGAELEEAVGDHPPFYRPILVEEQNWWVAPGKGLLGGTLVSLATSTDTFVLRDFSGTLWTVDAHDLRGNDLLVLARGGMVRIVGAPVSASSTAFHACFVFPWTIAGVFQDAQLPPPLFVPATSTERASTTPRSDICRGIRPYTQLRTLDENGL